MSMNTTSKRISTHCVRTPQLLLQYKITAKISIVLWHVSSYNILQETRRFACRKYKIRKFFIDYYITFAYALFYLPTYLIHECEYLCVKVIIFIISFMNNLWSCPVAILWNLFIFKRVSQQTMPKIQNSNQTFFI